MFRLIRLTMSAAMLGGAWLALQPAPAIESLPEATAAAIGAPTSVPWGWADFCQHYHRECAGGAKPAADIVLSPKAASEISRVNRWVNAHVKPKTDMDRWVMADRWDYPRDGKGGFNGSALLKRKLLIDLGYPRQALLMTVACESEDEGRPLLTVKTDRGDFVLDDQSDEMRPWNRTDYRFIKRQSQQDPNVWLKILPSGAALLPDGATM